MVNPDVYITLKRSTGYITDKAGKQVPQYETLKGTAQIQAMSSSDLRHTDNLKHPRYDASGLPARQLVRCGAVSIKKAGIS